MPGWSEARLGELCKIQSGSSNTKDAVEDGQFIFFDRSKKPKRSNRYLFDCEALIIAGEGSEFHPKKVNGKFDLHQRAYAIYGFGDHLLGDYLFFYLEHVHRYFQDVAVGATVKSLRQRHFENLPIILPPLDEQKRIVAVLGQAFAALDRAHAHAEINLADAEVLFTAILDERYEQLASRNEVRPLLDLCAERGITYGVIKLGNHIQHGVPCLRTSNVRSLRIETEGMKKIATSLSKEYSRTILNGGEVLVNVRGTLGGVAVVPNNMAGWNISREVAMLDIAAVNPFFTAFIISSTTAQNWLTGVTKGAAYKGINLSDLRKLEIPVPDKDTQEAVVQELRAQRRAVDRLETEYADKISDIADLRQSLLKKAFSGQLT